MLQDADGQAADDAHAHDHQPGHGVTAHELAGAVHGAEEVRFLGDFLAPLAGLRFADQTGVEVGVDRHLLAGHRVEGEACADFGDTPGTLGDHHEVDGHQDQEQRQAHGKVAAHQELTEGFDHLAGRVGAGVAFHQDHPRGRHVQRQAQQGGEQQHRGKRREVQRLFREHADHQHHDRQGDIEGEQQVEDERGQRQDHHRQDEHDQHRAGHDLEVGGGQPGVGAE